MENEDDQRRQLLPAQIKQWGEPITQPSQTKKKSEIHSVDLVVNDIGAGPLGFSGFILGPLLIIWAWAWIRVTVGVQRT